MGLGVLVGCSSGDPGEETMPNCLTEPANLDCAPAYGLAADGVSIEPTFQQVFDNTLPRCAATAGCHRAPNPPHGLAMDDIDAAYQGLLDAGQDRVNPGDVRCGKLIVRLESVGKPWSMPPGDHLRDAELCSLRHWIANGAKR